MPDNITHDIIKPLFDLFFIFSFVCEDLKKIDFSKKKKKTTKKQRYCRLMMM
jgi:hypothetical protein